MKKFQFPLEKLLSYKEQALDSERMTLAAMNRDLHQMRQKKSALADALAQCRKDLEDLLARSTTPAVCCLHISYTEHLKDMLRSCEKDMAKLKRQIDDQVDVIRKLKLETKSLETLKASKLDDYRKEDLKAWEQQMDEYVSAAKIMSQGF